MTDTVNTMSNPTSDYIVNSAAHRNFNPEFIANTHLDYALGNDRLKSYLGRTLKKATSGHRDRVRRSQPAVGSDQAQTNPVNSNVRLNNQGAALNGTVQFKELGRPMTIVDDALSEHDTSISATEAMSTRTAFKKHQKDWYDSQRQSLRRTQKLHEDPNSFLIFKVNNIRKKLNWKESKTARELPPRKKPRHESVNCDISLAIWDNSGPVTSKLPLVIKREFCQSTKIKRETDSTNGDFVELKLDEPFIISQKDLRVAAGSGRDRMALAKQYFMEIKITPQDEKVVWPPIPMLGKSDGERFNGMGTDAKDETRISMIARYQHLPTAPEADTPLSIFVYAEGRTFRTKYGLEVSAQWVPKDHPTVIRKPSPDPEVESWALDGGTNPFGRVDPNRKATKPVAQPARKTALPSRKSVARVPRPPKITYHIQVSKGAKSGFNRCSIRGLKCYSCSGKSFESLTELRFHLDQNHKNRVTIERQVIDPEDSRLTAATILIETPSNQRLKAIQGAHDDDVDKIFTYVAPEIPFDLDLHYSDKKTPWTEVLPAQPSREATKAPSMLPTTSDSQSVLRKQHTGHVPYRNVLPFRPQAYQRKKFSNKKLLTKHVSLENPYTSISHRPVHCDDDEDARSETDDEIDDSWFVDRHLEELDLHSWQENWSDARRRLAKKWDWHILHRERGISAKYMSDCLIRFVRIEKKWLLREDLKDDPMVYMNAQMESIDALTEMMDELKNMRTINEAVCSDVMTMLFNDDELEVPAEEQKEIETQTADLSMRKKKIRQYKKSTKQHGSLGPSSSICADCRLPIGHDKQRAVRCCNLRCNTPNVWYHAKCAGLSLGGSGFSNSAASTQAMVVNDFMKTRSTWKCNRCMQGEEKGKGKDKAV